MKSARVYSVTKWYAKCPGCKTEHHVRDNAPPFHPEQIYCKRCDAVFAADLEDSIAERERLDRLAARSASFDKPAHLCTCRSAPFGRHDLHCEVKRKESGR